MFPNKRKPGRPRKHPLPTGAATDYKVPLVDRDVPPTPATAGEKVSVPLTVEGKIDFDGMQMNQPGGLGKLREAIASDPKAPEQLGIKPAAADGSDSAPLVTEDHARALYSALDDIFGFTLSKRTHLPRTEILKVIGYTETDYGKLCPLTSKVLNRHLPASTVAMQEIGLLIAEVWEIHQRKYIQLMEYLQKKQEENMRAGGVAPNGGAGPTVMEMGR